MFTGRFWAGAATGAILAIALVGWFLSKNETEISFPAKTVYATDSFAAFSGSIVDKEQNPINGTTMGECERQSGICRFYTVNQTGYNQVGSINPYTLKIRQWDDRVLLADTQGSNSKQCYYFEIRIDLASEEISYTRFRQKNDGACADGEPNVSYWKIDDSYSTQRLSE
jgi:hypothetical protein